MSPHRSSSHVKSLTRVEAFVSDAVSDEITMQRYCFFPTWPIVVPNCETSCPGCCASAGSATSFGMLSNLLRQDLQPASVRPATSFGRLRNLLRQDLSPSMKVWKQKKCKINVNKLTLAHRILWARMKLGPFRVNIVSSGGRKFYLSVVANIRLWWQVVEMGGKTQ